MRCLNHAALILALILPLLLGLACNRDGGAQSNTNQGGQQPPTFADAQSAATQSLATFRQLVNDQNFKELGFESRDEAASATLGEPLRVLFVGLNQLRAYQPGSDPSALLTDFNQLSYPVMVRDQVRSSVVVEQVGGKWKTASLGNGALARQVAAVRKAPTAPAGSAGGTDQQVLVHVAALGLHFYGQRVDNKLMLTPLAAYPQLNLRAGAAMPAEEVFTALVSAARAISDDAPM
jgi:hypothetical protein